MAAVGLGSSLMGSAINAGGAGMVVGAQKLASAKTDADGAASILNSANVNHFGTVGAMSEEWRKEALRLSTLKRDTDIGNRNELMQGVKKISF